jgi:hypothetical protein
MADLPPKALNTGWRKNVSPAIIGIMAENSNLGILGRKIFFLYPSALIQNQIITELAQEEFEVYSVRNETKLYQVLTKFPNSIVFTTLNEGMKEGAVEEWIKKIAADPKTAGVDVGIISAGIDENIRRKYIEQLKVRCGFTLIKSDLGGVIKQLIDTLGSVDAKGRRKYIRAVIDSGSNTTVNLPVNGNYKNGVVKDVSTVGFSCTFSEDLALAKNSLLGDIQLRLQTQLLKTEGIVFGSRMAGEEKIYVFLFTQRTSPDVKTRIRKFIQSHLQSRMDAELK